MNQYVNGVIVPDTFTITASGLPTTYFEFTSSNNSFSAKNKYGYADGFTVTCVSNSTGESVFIVIEFRPL